MIISHKHKFIFIHCRKVAGSSMKVALAPFLGKNDIVIGSINEIIASGISLNKASKKTLITPKGICFTTVASLLGKTLPEAINIGIKSYYKNKLSKNPPHPKASEVAQYFPDEWNQYFKFAFTRNPYERVVSDYLWRKRQTQEEISFTDYLHLLKSNNSRARIIHPENVSNWEMITINDTLVIDEIGKYENLEKDFLKITNKIIGKDIKLNQEKVNFNKINYSSFYSVKEKELVSQIFNKEIIQFGYNFPYQ